uniref:DUF2345 domain-containing protein n=1 Tax=Pseudomonas agarici TaxID=46677 RepID=UPI0003660B59
GKAGLLSLTPKHQIWTAGTHCLLNAGADINLTAQGHTAFLAGEGLVLFTQGDSGAERPVANTGITLHAATGAISLQAQSDKVSVAAQGDIRLISTQAGAQVEGKSHVLLSAEGAAIKLSGGNIEITAPGAVTFKAQQHVLLEPKSGISVPRILGKGQLTGCEFKEGGADLSGASVVESKGNAHG